MAAGNFTASNLYNVQARLEEMWSDSALNRDMINPIDSLNAIAENQKIKTKQVLVDGNCRELEVSWIKPKAVGDDEDYECLADAASCEIEGDEMESLKKNYKVDQCIRDTFFVWDDECDNTIKAAELIAEGMYNVEKAIENKLNKRAIGFLSANTDDNTVLLGNISNVANVGSYFPAEDWDHNLIAQLALLMEMNKVGSPIFLTGTNLWINNFNAKYNQLNSDQKDQIAKLKHFPNWYFDPLNVDSVTAMKSTFAFNAGSVAVLNKNHYKTMAPTNQNDPLNTHIWKKDCKNLTTKVNGATQKMVMDCAWQRKCKTENGHKRFGTAYEFSLKYEFVTSPTGLDGKLGIFKLINGDPA